MKGENLNMQAMSASPFVEMSAKTVSANRETEKRDSAGSEKNFDQKNF